MANEQQPGKNIVETASEIGMRLAASGAKMNPHPHGRSYVVLKDGDGKEVITYLDRPDLPPRRAGTVFMNDTESFLEYWKRQSNGLSSYIYGSIKPAQFVAVLNEQTGGGTAANPEAPQWRDHRAVYILAHSREWITWMALNGKDFEGNDAFAYFLEDNLPDIIEPSPADMMDIALNIKVTQAQGFQKAVRLQDGNINLSYINDVSATAQAGPDKPLTIPEQFTIKIPVFEGIVSPMYEIKARFRYRLNSGRLHVRYELVRPHKTVEEAFKGILDKINSESGTTVLFGRPDAT